MFLEILMEHRDLQYHMINRKTMHRIIVVLLFYVWISELSAQTTWAGPDTASCGNKGVMIGSMDPCSSCCYSWTPVDGLSDPKIKNPIAKPRTKTTYTVVVTDENLSWKQTDAVEVDLDFGEIHFVPDHLEQGSTEIVLGRLLNNKYDSPTTWSFDGPDLDCMIEPSIGDEDLATFHAGDRYGKLRVKVTKDSDPACFFIETLPVNSGVKDLIVVDPQHTGRTASTGDTLYLVGHGDVQLIAVPNEGGFDEGIPDYKPDQHGSNLPEDGVRIQTVTDDTDIAGNVSDYIAGDLPYNEPQITVVRVTNSTNTTDLSGSFVNIVNWWENLFNFSFITDGYGPNQPYGSSCPPQSPPIAAAMALSVAKKETPVEKYNSPALGEKQEYVLDMGVTVTGRLYHPYFTRHAVIAGIGFCRQLYCGMTYSNNFNIGVSKDESQANGDWKLDNPQVEFGLSGEVGFTAAIVSGTGYNLEGSGSATAGMKVVLGYDVGPKNLFGQFKLTPTTVKIEAKLVNETNMGETQPLFNLLSKEVLLFEGKDFPPIILYTFE